MSVELPKSLIQNSKRKKKSTENIQDQELLSSLNKTVYKTKWYNEMNIYLNNKNRFFPEDMSIDILNFYI